MCSARTKVFSLESLIKFFFFPSSACARAPSETGGRLKLVFSGRSPTGQTSAGSSSARVTHQPFRLESKTPLPATPGKVITASGACAQRELGVELAQRATMGSFSVYDTPMNLYTLPKVAKDTPLLQVDACSTGHFACRHFRPLDNEPILHQHIASLPHAHFSALTTFRTRLSTYTHWRSKLMWSCASAARSRGDAGSSRLTPPLLTMLPGSISPVLTEAKGARESHGQSPSLKPDQVARAQTLATMN